MATWGLIATGGWADAADEPKPTPPVVTVADPPLAERFARIKADHEAEQAVLRRAVDQAANQPAVSEAYAKLAPDEVAYCRRMIELAQMKPTDPAARDALLWVINKPGRPDQDEYGDEFARAAALLVRHHGDDPTAVAVGLGLSNVLTAHRDVLLLGFYAAAKGREAKGTARLALAQYLEKKAQFVRSATKYPERRKLTYHGVIGDDGKPYDKVVDESDEQFAYTLALRLGNADAIRAEAERLYDEVIADYADVPHVTLRQIRLAELLKQPRPTSNGKPMTAEEIDKIRRQLARPSTLGAIAEARLDDLFNIIPGKPAPAIDGVDLDGKPLKLADYRGKVVALVFWGSWCGPCMREIPAERDLAARLKDRPFALLGVNCNETRAAGLKAAQAEGMTWPSWHDGDDSGGPIASRYHVRGYPTVFVIDAQGIIRAKRAIGTGLDETVDKLLKEMDAAGSP